MAAVTVGSRNTRYRAARYGLTRTGLSPVGLHQLWLALSEIQAKRKPRTHEYNEAATNNVAIADVFDRLVSYNVSSNLFFDGAHPDTIGALD